ncbi:MAG: hypothetical protein IKA12_03335 [Clostridia bacterium]|nr:hypothetical protein [Clostridia bacterium]
MVTARRSNDITSIIGSENRGGVAILEKNPNTYNQFVEDNNVTEHDMEETKLRMQRNLEMIMNYDKQVTDTVEDVQVEAQQVSEITAVEDEDICPTSTTMQFGDGDLDQMYKEMNRAQETTKENYKLTTKGKIVVAIYAAVVAVIFALIVLNTSLLAVLTNSNAQKAEILTAQTEQYNAIMSEIESVSQNDYIADIAQNQFGMVLGN